MNYSKLIGQRFIFITNSPIGTHFLPGEKVILVKTSYDTLCFKSAVEGKNYSEQWCSSTQVILEDPSILNSPDFNTTNSEELDSFPKNGWCEKPNKKLLAFLSKKLSYDGGVRAGKNGIAWNSTSAWPIETASSNGLFTIEQLEKCLPSDNIIQVTAPNNFIPDPVGQVIYRPEKKVEEEKPKENPKEKLIGGVKSRVLEPLDLELPPRIRKNGLVIPLLTVKKRAK